MGIRTTEITDEEGNVTIVNNSKINPIQNMTRSYAQKESEGKKDPTEEAKDVSKGGSGDDSDDDDD